MSSEPQTNGAGKKLVLLLGVFSVLEKEKTKTWPDHRFKFVKPEATNRAKFLAEARSGRFDDCEACIRTFDSVEITGLIDRELTDALPKSIKFLCHLGAGYDQIDPNACRDCRIQVSNVPTAVDDSTADANIFLILGALRNFNYAMMALRKNEWRGSPAPPLGHDPQGKLLGILGMGGIGRNLKKKAEAFGMVVQYHNRTKLSEELSGGAKYVSMDELLRTSDVISLNLPLNEKTRHIISTPQFEKMKHGVVIVNTARGAVIDEAALVEALKSNVVRSCGLDVFEDEPQINAGLINDSRVMLLPHMGTWTVETQEKMERWCLENMELALTEGRLKSPIPEHSDW